MISREAVLESYRRLAAAQVIAAELAEAVLVIEGARSLLLTTPESHTRPDAARSGGSGDTSAPITCDDPMDAWTP